MFRRSLILLLFTAFLSVSAQAADAPWLKKRVPASEPSQMSTSATQGKSLEEVYRIALTRAYSINIQDEVLAQANEVNRQAKGALLPTIGGSATFLEQQGPSSSGAATPTGLLSTFKLSADQPLFRGFRDFAALRQKGDLLNANKFLLQDAARQLFYNTAQAYYNVLEFQSDELNYRNEIEVNQKRLIELEGFVRIGRSQITDVLSQKSTISGLEATLESAHGQLENAKEVLAFFTGMDRATPLQDAEQVPATPNEVDRYLEKIEQRPDVQAAVASVQANEEGVPIAWGQHLPSVDLLGDYYYAARPSESFTPSGTGWDLSVGITVPIFQGGVILSETRQAASVARQFNVTLDSTRANAMQEIRQFFDSFSADQRQIAKLEETADLGKKNYEALIREYRNGLVTNLEVLTGITTWQDTLRTLAHQQFVAHMDYVKLQAASAQRKEIFIDSAKVQ